MSVWGYNKMVTMEMEGTTQEWFEKKKKRKQQVKFDLLNAEKKNKTDKCWLNLDKATLFGLHMPLCGKVWYHTKSRQEVHRSL